MTPGEVPAEVVAAAQQADAEWNRTRLARGDLGRNWQGVGDAQVRRLIAAAVTAERERIAAYLARRGNDLASGTPEPFAAAAAITHFDIAQTILEGTDG